MTKFSSETLDILEPASLQRPQLSMKHPPQDLHTHHCLHAVLTASKHMMATSQIIPSSKTRFSKYSELPQELRLQIIEEAIEAYKALGTRRGLAKFATIDSEWNQSVERILFSTIDISNQDLVDFENICGKQQEILKQISFVVSNPHHPESASATMEKLVTGSLSQLFRVMKNWSRADKGPHGLIKLHLHVEPWLMLVSAENLAPSLCCDFTDLPEVPVIGRMHANQHVWSKYHLDVSTLDFLHEKLPGLYNARLEIPCQALPQETINDASSEYHYASTKHFSSQIVNNIFEDRIISFHAAKPSLTKLSVSHRNVLSGHLVGHRNRITITEALAPRVSLWSNSLVCLKLDSVMDIAQFLSTASESVWPHLHRLDLTGCLDKYDDDSDRAVDDEEQAFNDLLQGLTEALPSMRNLIKFGVRFRDHRKRRSYLFSMDLTPRIKTEWQHWPSASPHRTCPSKDPVIPCGSLPTSVSGIIKAYHVTLAGDLVKALQDTVWQQRRLHLAVFCCRQDPEMGFLEPGPCCTQWNKETDSWDPAFMNGMDGFIFDMGQYWFQTNPPQWGFEPSSWWWW